MEPSTEKREFQIPRRTQEEIIANIQRDRAAINKILQVPIQGNREGYLAFRAQICKECDLVEEEVQSLKPKTLEERKNLIESILKEEREEFFANLDEDQKKTKRTLMTLILRESEMKPLPSDASFDVFQRPTKFYKY